MMVIEEAEIPLAFSVWARGGQAPLRAQTSLFTDLFRRTCWPADLLAGGPAVAPRAPGAPGGAAAARAAG